MGTYAVKIDSLNYFAVYHSTTETLYSPTWDEDHEIEAHAFAWIMGNLGRRLHMARNLGLRMDDAIFADGNQVAAQIRAFFDEKLGEDREEARYKTLHHGPWVMTLNGENDSDPVLYDLYDLTEMFEEGDDKVGFIVDEILAWTPTAVEQKGARK